MNNKQNDIRSDIDQQSQPTYHKPNHTTDLPDSNSALRLHDQSSFHIPNAKEFKDKLDLMDDQTFNSIYLKLIQKKDEKEKFQLPELNTDRKLWRDEDLGDEDVNEIEDVRDQYLWFYEDLINNQAHISDFYSANSEYVRDILSPVINVPDSNSEWRITHRKLDIPDFHGTWLGKHGYGEADFLHELISAKNEALQKYDPDYHPLITAFYDGLINQWNSVKPKEQIDISSKKKIKMFHDKERLAYKKLLICWLYQTLNNNSIFFWFNVLY